MSKIVDSAGKPLQTDDEKREAIDRLEAEELSVKITSLVRATFGYIPHPKGLNRKIKRRLQSVLRSAAAHRIAKAIRSKYHAKRQDLLNSD